MLSQEEKNTVDCFDADYEPRTDEVFPAEKRLIPQYFDEGDQILELGCGMCRLTSYLEAQGYDVIAMDISKNRVETASQRITSEVMIMDAGNISFRDDSFDGVIFSHNGIDYLHPYKRRVDSLTEIYRVLKQGGTFIYSTHNRLWVPVPWEEPFNFLDYMRDRVLSGDILIDMANTNGKSRVMRTPTTAIIRFHGASGSILGRSAFQYDQSKQKLLADGSGFSVRG